MKAISIIHDVFVSAAEREIHTGDGIHFNIITKVSFVFCTEIFYVLEAEKGGDDGKKDGGDVKNVGGGGVA
jgi:hypothetical protein